MVQKVLILLLIQFTNLTSFSGFDKFTLKWRNYKKEGGEKEIRRIGFNLVSVLRVWGWGFPDSFTLTCMTFRLSWMFLISIRQKKQYISRAYPSKCCDK